VCCRTTIEGMKFPGGENLTYIKGTPCVLGCVSIIRKLIKILSMQPGVLSNNKPKIFSPTALNKVILEPIVSKEVFDWTVQNIKNTKKDLNANHAVSLYNINRKLSHLVSYDLNIDEKVLDKYINYVNTEIEYLDSIVNQLGGGGSGTLNLDDLPSKSIIINNEKRRELVKKAFNGKFNPEKNEPNLPDE
jgi:hypothetical protein